MKRRRALTTLLVGGVAAALIHPKSRKKVIRYGKRGFDTYRDIMIRLSEKRTLSEKDRSDLRARFNFASKEEEEKFFKQFLKDFQETRIRNREFFRRKLTDQELIKYVKALTRNRREFAKDHLREASFEGKAYTREDVGRALIRYFELNQIINNYVEGGAKAVVIGCTELPLVINQTHTKVKLFNTIDILALSTLKEAYK